MNDDKATVEDSKSGPEMAQTVAQTKTATDGRRSKTHQDFWKTRLLKRTYRDRDGQMVEMPEWHVRIAALGQRNWFNLGTSNQAAAAVKARDIYVSLITVGLEATLVKHKPSPAAKAEICTVGEFLADVGVRSHLKAMTVRRYAVKLRKMVADIARLEEGLKAKARRTKYDHVTGGRAAWLAKVDGQSLDLLTAEEINAWRNAYVAKAGADPVKRKSAERSAASYLRCVRALFTEDVLSVLKVKLPANPFEGVKLKDPGPARYHSEIDPAWLLGCAEQELRDSDTNAYLALFLCLWAGLRRKEADLLMWAQVDLEAGELSIRRTAYFEPKTEESVRTIDLAPAAVDVLRVFKKWSGSEFVLKGSDPDPAATYDFYRCDCTWRDLNAWLRGKGVSERKAIHSLRKESGSLIASAHGIEAARQHLGHRDIRTTSSHYVDKKKRHEVSIGASQLRVVEGSA
ncbi:MAG: tyrosine-type recombinase/integrase [Verrucomicrobia bacterium]|nr:tyrosine-type recombinase/integrase [Verrucomicrobiota bacterium]